MSWPSPTLGKRLRCPEVAFGLGARVDVLESAAVEAGEPQDPVVAMAVLAADGCSASLLNAVLNLGVELRQGNRPIVAGRTRRVVGTRHCGIPPRMTSMRAGEARSARVWASPPPPPTLNCGFSNTHATRGVSQASSDD